MFKEGQTPIFAILKISSLIQAEVAHLVEHDLAKVGVAGSSPVFRSLIFLCHSGGGTGRHAGLKILFAVMQVWVQLPSRVLNNQ